MSAASDTKAKARAKVFNVPNQVTALRLALSIGVFVLIPLKLYGWALIVFLIAASTDWVDGYWARKYNQVTQLGRIFDPFVDKIIICGTFIYLAAIPQSGIWPWMAVVVVGREILVTALRGFIEQQGGDFSANKSGKLKMVLQCAAVAASLLALMYVHSETPHRQLSDQQPLYWTVMVLVVLAVASTIQSGLVYVAAARKSILE